MTTYPRGDNGPNNKKSGFGNAVVLSHHGMVLLMLGWQWVFE